MSTLIGTRRALLGSREKALDFDPGLVTFTAGMAKRTGTVFAAAPIVQGDNLGYGADAIVSTSSSTIAGYFSSFVDNYQGTVVLFYTPEFADLKAGGTSTFFFNFNLRFVRAETEKIIITMGSQAFFSSVCTWVAGQTYCLVFRWDFNNTLDGTNYFCISIDDAHQFGITTKPTIVSPGSAITIGSWGSALRAAEGIIEGLHVYRRVLFDGDYGVNVGNGDEVALISAGSDPCLITGSWDCVFALPTDSSTGAL